MIAPLAEVLRTELAGPGLVVSLINPGYVDTPMTAENKFPMPCIVKVEDAARRFIRGLEKQRFEIAFPWRIVTLLKLARILPYGIYLRLAGRRGSQ